MRVNVWLCQLSASVWLFMLQCVGVPQEPLSVTRALPAALSVELREQEERQSLL